ncbi:unnamed protein product [Rotaria sp. Silwood2]|nr:unnamed protein product [Rotaria sp. Silwood2]
MKGADIGIGWVDQAGNVHFQDRYAFGMGLPIIDNTTTDWFHLQGREQNGWTSIQFKRLLDTCDSMDVPIISGTNILIFAYGLVDPDLLRSGSDISYHDTRRGTRIIPLRSYGNPSSEEKFAGLDSVDFRVSNYRVPSEESNYYCKVYKSPAQFLTKRHAVAHKVLIDSANRDLVHHLVLYECDPAAVFDDTNLPDDVCDNVYAHVHMCMSNSAIVWAVGGDDIEEFPEEAGYPIGGDLPVKYYVLEIHYDNPRRTLNRIDSTGVRFYIGKELRQYDLGFLSFGTGPNPSSLAIPPQANQFVVDSYCSPRATQHLPESGITLLSAFPHTHLQGNYTFIPMLTFGLINVLDASYPFMIGVRSGKKLQVLANIRNDDIGVANLAFALNRRMNIKLLDCRSQIVFHYQKYKDQSSEDKQAVRF